MSINPGSFVLVCPTGVLWTGGYGAQGSIVGSQDWGKILTEQSSGHIEDGSARFFWTTRYLGNLPLVYAIPENAGQSQPASAPAQSSPDSATVAAGEVITLHEGQPQNDASFVTPLPSTRQYIFGSNAVPLVPPTTR
jgi:hypothetical protein